MTYKEGWLERQLDLATKSVNEWPETKRETLSLDRSNDASDNNAYVRKVSTKNNQDGN